MMNRVIVTAPLAVAVSLLFIAASVSPAEAASDEVCATMPEQIRDRAETIADADTAKKALKYALTGEMLCEAGNERAAKKKFETAFKTLGVSPDAYAERSQ